MTKKELRDEITALMNEILLAGEVTVTDRKRIVSLLNDEHKAAAIEIFNEDRPLKDKSRMVFLMITIDNTRLRALGSDDAVRAAVTSKDGGN